MGHVLVLATQKNGTFLFLFLFHATPIKHALDAVHWDSHTQLETQRLSDVNHEMDVGLCPPPGTAGYAPKVNCSRAFCISNQLFYVLKNTHHKKKDGNMFVDPSPYTITLLIAYDEVTSISNQPSFSSSFNQLKHQTHCSLLPLHPLSPPPPPPPLF